MTQFQTRVINLLLVCITLVFVYDTTQARVPSRRRKRSAKTTAAAAQPVKNDTQAALPMTGALEEKLPPVARSQQPLRMADNANANGPISPFTENHLLALASSPFAESAGMPSEMAGKDAPPLDHDNEDELAPLQLPFDIDDDQTIEFQFQDADLRNLVTQVEALFDCKFISDDMIQPLKNGTKTIKGNTISFKTVKPLTKQEAWNLFLTFLDIAGFTVVPQPEPRLYRIQSFESARRAPVPTFIDTDYTKLADNDETIRYMYFLKNTDVQTIQPIIEALKSAGTNSLYLAEQKAFVLTDKSFNIKSLMRVVTELDKVCMPQAMSILKLRNADAEKVAELYRAIANPADNRNPAQLFGARKQPTSLYFPENTRIIPEPRTNSLILLGTRDAIAKIEDFIIKHVDVELEQPYPKLFTYQLKYADADTIANIMNSVTEFGRGTPAGTSGGVRGKDKFLKPITFVPDKSTNRIVIKGDFEDYMVAKGIIDKLDEAQPQVAIEVLVLLLNVQDRRSLGTQMRSKVNGLDGILGSNIKFQTSGLTAQGTPAGIVTRTANDAPGVTRLLGNLIDLAVGALPGNTIITLGQDGFGVWGICQALQQLVNLQIVANPFLVATNHQKASVSLGELRRILVGQVINDTGAPTNEFGDSTATLKVDITPQINSDGMTTLDVNVEFNEFTSPNASDGNQINRKITTVATVADQEVLALGGVIRNRYTDNMNKVPLLGDVPILGWLFKNKEKEEQNENLLVLISAQILQPEDKTDVREFTGEHIGHYQDTLAAMQQPSDRRDPINRMFFGEDRRIQEISDNFILERGKNYLGKESDSYSRHLEERKAARYKARQKEESTTEVEAAPVAPVHLAHNSRLEKIKTKRRNKISLSDLALQTSDDGEEANA